MPDRQTRPGTRSRREVLLLIVAVAAVAAGLVVSTLRDIRHGDDRVQAMMIARARAVADILAESSRHGLETYAHWDREVRRRLLDNALWLAELDSLGRLRAADLPAMAATHGLYRIFLFDRSGRLESSSLPDTVPFQPPRDPAAVLAPILSGGRRTLVLPGRSAAALGDAGLVAAARRASGGAVVVAVPVAELRHALTTVSPGHLIQTLGAGHGIRYAAIQDSTRILAASARVPDLPRPVDDPRLSGLATGTTDVAARELVTDTGPVFEVTRRLEIPGRPSLWLRIGMDARALAETRAAVRRDAFWRAALLLLVLGVGAGLLLAWQRQTLLQREIARARREIAAREAAARRAEKLTAMGALASGVAHEIRNPLNSIHMLAQRLGRREGLDEEVRRWAAHIRDESGRIEQIVQQFLQFTRPRTPQWEPLSAAEVVAKAARVAAAACAKEARLELDVADTELVCDRHLLTEIVDNLVRNACQAVDDGGLILVTGRPVGDRYVVEVADDGPGVPPELRERIFDLYFTTRPDGTGLGLSLTAQMAGALGGSIELADPEPEGPGGARFVVTIPVRGGEDA